MAGSLLGPAASPSSLRAMLDARGAKYTEYSRRRQRCASAVADLMARENVVGWFQGRMEFGPRALGARSIIGDARSPSLQSTMNLKIKFRESFRPFAPVVLKERVADYFEMAPDTDSPYMLLVAPVREDHRRSVNGDQPRGLDRVKLVRSDIPAVTHVDYSARVQTVDRDRHGRFTSAAGAVRAADRLSGDHQHELQRARRTDRLHARAGLPLLHGDQHGCARARAHRAAQVRAAGVAGLRSRRVRRRVSGRLMLPINRNPSARELDAFDGSGCRCLSPWPAASRGGGSTHSMTAALGVWAIGAALVALGLSSAEHGRHAVRRLCKPSPIQSGSSSRRSRSLMLFYARVHADWLGHAAAWAAIRFDYAHERKRRTGYPYQDDHSAERAFRQY